jgi:ABC-type branched-subunit amino acid transport system ATPase component/ABC-type branched-subunit amino acid transport system permease subunit
VFASLAGLMLAPSLNLDAFMITMLVVQAFGAAAIGYFSSLPLTFVGGLVIGIGGSLATKYAAQVPSLAGLPSSLPFAVLILALVLTPRARLVQRRLVAERVARPPYHAPVRVRSVFGLVVVGVLMLVPVLAGTYLSVWSNFLIETLLLLSLGVLVRMSGQISLCQYAFAAIGASTFSHLATSAHLPLALLLAALISIPVGAVVSIPAIRLSGVFLALATLGFGIFVEQMLYNTSFMFGSLTNGIAAPRPNVSLGSWQLSSDKGFYYLVLLIVAVLTVLVVLVQHARLGRLLRALSDSPIGLEAFGTSTNVTKAVVFCLSAVLASLAGALLAMLLHFSVGSNYVSFNSLTLLAVVVIATVGGPWYAVLGGLGLVVLPGYWTSPNASTYLEIAAGAAAVIFALQPDRVPRVPERLAALIDRLGGRRAATATAPAAAPPRPAALRPVAERSPAGDGLRVSGLTVRFGGITAVRDAGLHAPMNAITGLVGPNGAGKTTIFNACSGLIRASSGRIELHGRTVTRASAPARARLGLGRTFQKPQLFESLTVMENVALGREAGLAGANPFRQIASSRAERLSVGAAVDDALYSVGIAGLAGRPVALLSLGQKRLVELARVVAGGFDVLLLDEPSSGLDPVETEAFGEVLTRIVAERGLGLLLVEHDMELVTRICRDVFVLDFGSIIFQGTTEEMTRSSVVRTAYLGEHDAALDAAASQAGVAEPWAEPAPATAVLDSDSVEVGR